MPPPPRHRSRCRYPSRCQTRFHSHAHSHFHPHALALSHHTTEGNLSRRPPRRGRTFAANSAGSLDNQAQKHVSSFQQLATSLGFDIEPNMGVVESTQDEMRLMRVLSGTFSILLFLAMIPALYAAGKLITFYEVVQGCASLASPTALVHTRAQASPHSDGRASSEPPHDVRAPPPRRPCFAGCSDT